MKHTIYYFTGTGNTLDIAKSISKKVNAELIPISKSSKDISGDLIGIAFPIYMFNAPRIVYKFLSKIKSCKYLYLVMTMGGNSGRTVEKIKSRLNKGVKLSASFSFMMPDNYIVWHSAMEQEKQKKVFTHAQTHIENIVEIINNQDKHFDDESKFPLELLGSIPFPFSVMPKSFLYWFSDIGFALIPKMDKAFLSTEKCNGCSTCAKICPSKNIEMIDKKPVWSHNCEQCFACLQWCPQEAIEYAKKSVGKKRYHNPNIKLNEMIIK